MAIENPYDHALKILARTYPTEFLHLGFPEQSVRLLEEQANVELALEIELILTYEKDQERQRTLLTTAILIAAQSKLFSSDFLWALFQEDQMDLDNPVIAKLFDRAYGEKLAAEKQKFAAETQKLAAEAQKLVAEAQKTEQKLQEELAEQRVMAAEADAARRETEAEAVRRETEMTQQWQALMFKVLEHRFPTVPMALILLLQAMKPSQRSQVSDIILDSPDVDRCLQALRQLQVEA